MEPLAPGDLIRYEATTQRWHLPPVVLTGTRTGKRVRVGQPQPKRSQLWTNYGVGAFEFPRDGGREMYPNLHTPAYFEVDGRPAVIRTERAFPRVYDPRSRTWPVEYDLPKFFAAAERINRVQFDRLTAALPPLPAPQA